MIRGLALILLGLALLAGCSGSDESDAETTTVRVYFLRDGEVWPVAREVPSEGSVANAALAALLDGPTEEEREELGMTTAIPEEIDTIEVVQAADSVPRIELSDDVVFVGEPFAQTVYTVTQFPGMRVVAFDGRARTFRRSDFEQYTPPVLVETPLAFEEVSNPIRALGTANTFEANFNYEVLDADGEIVAENFVTATSGTGTRGTFELMTPELDVASDDVTLVVFEHSAEDGSRMNEVEIPLRLAQD